MSTLIHVRHILKTVPMCSCVFVSQQVRASVTESSPRLFRIKRYKSWFQTFKTGGVKNFYIKGHQEYLYLIMRVCLLQVL